MTYKDMLDRILAIDKKIRFATIVDHDGKVSSSGHHQDIKNLLTYDESQQLLQLAVKSWNARNLYEGKIGEGEYAIAVYKKLKRITVKLDKEHLAYLTTERDADHDKIVLEILRIEN